MRKFRGWLAHNRVIIDFVSKIVLGAAALFISFAAYRVADRQSIIAEQQLKYAALGSEPDFYVRETLTRDPTTEKYDHTRMEISNSGGQAHNIDASTDSFIHVRRWGPERTTGYLPILAYYFAHFRMGVPQGLVYVAEGFRSNAKFGELYDELLKEEFKKQYGFIEARVQTLVTISYETRAGQKRKVYFWEARRRPEAEVLPLVKLKQKSEELICYVQVLDLKIEDVLRNEERLRKNERCLT